MQDAEQHLLCYHLPVVYYLDQTDRAGDIRLMPNGTVDAVATLTNANADTANWTDNGVPKGDIYGDGIAAPITQALGRFIAPRNNDDPVFDKRLEIYRRLRVPELWRYDGETVTFLVLNESAEYEVTPVSRAFRFLAAKDLTRNMSMRETKNDTELELLFEKWLCSQLAKPRKRDGR